MKPCIRCGHPTRRLIFSGRRYWHVCRTCEAEIREQRKVWLNQHRTFKVGKNTTSNNEERGQS